MNDTSVSPASTAAAGELPSLARTDVPDRLQSFAAAARTVLVPGRFPAVRHGRLQPAADRGRPAVSTRPRGSLVDDHFELELAWETSQGDYGSGPAIKLTDDHGCTWFFVDHEHDLVVKIVDPWSGFSEARYWIYSKCWLDVDIQVTVHNTWDGSRRLFHN